MALRVFEADDKMSRLKRVEPDDGAHARQAELDALFNGVQFATPVDPIPTPPPSTSSPTP